MRGWEFEILFLFGYRKVLIEVCYSGLYYWSFDYDCYPFCVVLQMKDYLTKKVIPGYQFAIAAVLIFIMFMQLGIMTVYRYGIHRGVVVGHSMEKTLKDGEKLLILDRRISKIKRYDFVSISVFIYGKRQKILKRVIALPHEHIRIKDDKVYINDKLLNEPYAYYDKQASADEWINDLPGNVHVIKRDINDVDITLGDEQYFVMGDNRMHSTDSREIGPVLKKYIEGVVFMHRKI